MGGADRCGHERHPLEATGRFNGSGRLSFAFSSHDVPRSATRYLAPLGIEASRQTELQLLLLKLEASLIGSCCVYQGEELACEDVRDIPHDRMRDPWGIEPFPSLVGTPAAHLMCVGRALPNGGFSVANSTWLPVSDRHLDRAGLDEVARPGSLYNDFSAFLTWRKSQPAMMEANRMSEISGGPDQIVFDRISDEPELRCSFDFKALTAEFEDIAIDEGAGTAAAPSEPDQSGRIVPGGSVPAWCGRHQIAVDDPIALGHERIDPQHLILPS